MRITFDETKRRITLLKRGLDFARAGEVFDGVELTWVDDRRHYGEARWNSLGKLEGRLVSVTWTLRDGERRIISMRKANEREQARHRRSLD